MSSPLPSAAAVRDAQTLRLQYPSVAEKPTNHREATHQCLTCLALHLQRLMPALGTDNYVDNPTTADSTHTHIKKYGIASTGLINKIRYSSKSTFSPHNCIYINALLALKKKVYKGPLPALAVPMYCTTLGPPLPRPTAAAQSANRIFQKSLCMCLHTHRDVQTYTGEEGREIC